MKTGLIQVVALSEQLFYYHYYLVHEYKTSFIFHTAFTTEHVFLPFMFRVAAAKNAIPRWNCCTNTLCSTQERNIHFYHGLSKKSFLIHNVLIQHKFPIYFQVFGIREHERKGLDVLQRQWQPQCCHSWKSCALTCAGLACQARAEQRQPSPAGRQKDPARFSHAPLLWKSIPVPSKSDTTRPPLNNVLKPHRLQGE